MLKDGSGLPSVMERAGRLPAIAVDPMAMSRRNRLLSVGMSVVFWVP
jgi:hypothetical protein